MEALLEGFLEEMREYEGEEPPDFEMDELGHLDLPAAENHMFNDFVVLPAAENHMFNEFVVVEDGRFCKRMPTFKGELHKETIRLDCMEKIAKYSFIAHRSINHLDLSLREFSSLREKAKVLVRIIFCSADPAYEKKFVSTSEGCRKTLRMKRRWLYSLHLDLPKDRERDILTFVPGTEERSYGPETACVDQLSVSDDVYKSTLRKFMLGAMVKSRMEMNLVRRYMGLMKRVLGVTRFSSDSLEDIILRFLFENCAHSDTIVELLQVLHMKSWISSRPDVRVLEYLLHHANRAGYDLRLNDRQGTLINECYFHSRFKYIESLLKYQNAPFFNDDESAEIPNYWTATVSSVWSITDLFAPYRRGLMSKRRLCLWLLVSHGYCFNVRTPTFLRRAFLEEQLICRPTLRLLWRSLPDAHFTLEELHRAYADVPNSHRFIEKVHRFFVESIAGDLVSGTPRPLVHHCRTSIRKSLCYNLKLPHGIENLGVPPKFHAYLKLESENID